MATFNDRAILESIINPLQPNKFHESEEHAISMEDDELNINHGNNEHVTKEARELEKKGVALAESGAIDEALEIFNSAIELSPNWSSAYNNRAQALRLLKRNEEAMADLDKAIELSQGKGKVASQAFCQRAMLHQLASNDTLAFQDWESASRLGSSFAKQQLVLRNPYAALCNKMLHDVFKSLKEGPNSS